MQYTSQTNLINNYHDDNPYQFSARCVTKLLDLVSIVCTWFGSQQEFLSHTRRRRQEPMQGLGNMVNQMLVPLLCLEWASVGAMP